MKGLSIRLVVLLAILAGTIAIARYSSDYKRKAIIGYMVAKVFAMKSGDHFVIDLSQE